MWQRHLAKCRRVELTNGITLLGKVCIAIKNFVQVCQAVVCPVLGEERTLIGIRVGKWKLQISLIPSSHGLITPMSSTWTIRENHLAASASPESSGMSNDSMPWYRSFNTSLCELHWLPVCFWA